MTGKRSIVTAALLALSIALSAGPASAASLPAGTTAILSGDSSLLAPFPAPVSSSETRDSTVSQDGRFVAFQSQSDGLYDGDDDRVSNVYVKDRVTGAVILASRASGAQGEPAHSYCYSPSISDDAARVAFSCEGSLDPADTNGPTTDVYVRELTTDTTYLASRAPNLGPVGDGPSSHPALSQAGDYVAFESEAKNLDPSANSSRTRVYRRHLGPGNSTVLVSRRAGVNGAAVSGSEPSISDDGNRIAFTGEALEGADPADTNSFTDVYVRDMAAGTTVLASRADGTGDVGNGSSRSPAIAGNGDSVAFESRANQFDHDADSDPSPDIYRRSLVTKATVLVSITAGGQKGMISTRPSLDDSGDVVGFVSSATALDPDDPNPRRDAYVKYLATNEMQVASRLDGIGAKVANAGAAAVAVSGDGARIGIGVDSGGSIAPGLDPRRAAVVVRELTGARHTDPVSRPAGTAPFTSAGAFSFGGALSADGRFAAFESHASALGLPDGVESAVFVRDRVTGEVTLASRADGPAGAPLPISDEPPAISGDGRRVAFTVGNGPVGGVWVRDLAAGRTFLASRADGPEGETANAESRLPELDADGSRVVFASNATNLGDGDTDGLLDVHVRDLESGQTILVSRGADGAKGDGESAMADISADGSRVAFSTYAKNLGDGDTDVQPDVHLRDLAAQTTTLVSATPDGTKSNGSVSRLSLDASGTRVAFDSSAGNFPGGNGSQYQVYVRDLAAGTLVLASRADGAEGAPGAGQSAGPVISPDGGSVAFASQATNLAPGVPERAVETYVRDLGAGRTELVSRASGADGRLATRGTGPTGVSAGAGCVSFVSEDGLVGEDSDYAQVYLRVRTADCDSGLPEARDTTAPVLSGARLTRKRFRVGRARTPLAARVRRGTVLRFRSSEAGSASVAFSREVRGRRGRVHLRTAGRLTRTIAEGPARVVLSGRLGRRPMRAGRYRLTLQVRDAAGNVSRPVRLKFRVAR
jgi:Tol biopolymer transport system component